MSNFGPEVFLGLCRGCWGYAAVKEFEGIAAARDFEA